MAPHASMPQTEPTATAARNTPCAVASACAGARALTYASDATHHSENESACSGWSTSSTAKDLTPARSPQRAEAESTAKTRSEGAEKRVMSASATAMSATSKTTPM